MIGTLDVECQAKNPNLPLAPMTAFINSPSSLRIRNVPKRIGDWCIRNVYVTCVYPDSSIQSVQCVLVGGIWVGTIQGTSTSGTSKNGYTIFADGTDENGNNVTGYVLGKGDIEILEADGTLSPDPARYTVKLLSAEATQPREGDMYPTDEGYVVWQDGEAHLLGTPFEQISAYVESAVSAKADLSTLEDYVPYTVDRNGSKTAVTVGTRTSEELVGQYSTSIGVLNALTRSNTFAVGFQNILSNDNSFAVGQNNTIGGTLGFAVGYSNKVNMSRSAAIGDTNTLSAESTQAFGTLNQVGGKYGIALGVKCRANDSGSFVWSGSDKNFAAQFPVYYSHGKGTFNVNPAGGLSGFYVGEQSLNDILSSKADLSAIPTKTSELSNDSGFVQQNGTAMIHDLTCDYLVANQAYIVGYATESDLSSKADLSAVPTKTSDLTNDSGFITSAQVPTPSYIQDANGNKISADRTSTWRTKNSWFISSLNDGEFTYDPPLECSWEQISYRYADSDDLFQKWMWISKSPYEQGYYIGIDPDLTYVEYYSKDGDIYVLGSGDAITSHTENSITVINNTSCSIARTSEWSEQTGKLALKSELPTNTINLSGTYTDQTTFSYSVYTT